MATYTLGSTEVVATRKLPGGYTQLSYIQGTGTQYIDTGFSTSTGMVVEYKANWQATGYVVGSHNPGSPYGRNGCYLHSAGADWEFGYGETCPSYAAKAGANLNVDYIIYASTKTSSAWMDVNGQRLCTASGQATSALTVKILACEYNMSTKTQAKVYYVKIWDSNDVLVRDYVPARRTSDNAIGMYDLVTKTFYGNSGTGTFTAGPAIILANFETGDIFNCEYSGAERTITLIPGTYQLEVWGARGGPYNSNYGGNGGYSKGTLTITRTTIAYIDVGQQPSGASGGWNGGGATNSYGGGGGGGTDIRINSNSLYARIIVAGGGGGHGYSSTVGGYGGGTSGGQGGNGSATGGYGGTQTGAGTNNTAGAFGKANSNSSNGGGGGGGWYGGASGWSAGTDSGGGGGSGYVYTSSTASSYPSGCILDSNYYLTNAQTYAGNTSFTASSGGTETGHASNGYARITALEIKNDWTITYNANGGSSTPATQTIAQGSSVTLASAISRSSSSSTFQLTGNANGHGQNTSATATKTLTYSFSYWNTNSSGTGTNYSAGSSITPSDNMTLYAKWSSTTSYSNNTVAKIPVPASTSTTTNFVLTGNGNGGTTTTNTASQTITYTFNNWNTSADGSGTSYSSTSTTKFTSAKTLYAQWNSATTYSGNRVCDIPIPTWQRHAFTCWNTKADGTGTAYPATSTTTFTSATTLYAQWQEIIQYVPYIYNGSSWVKYEIRTNNGTNFNDKYKGSIY